MRKLVLLAIAIVLSQAPAAWASDDGNTQPHFDSGDLHSPYGYDEVISTTSGTGNVKGVRCSTNDSIYLKIYVNGGSAQQLAFIQGDGNGDTGWIPMNLRFTSSIRVRIERPNGSYATDTCYVSWAFD